MRIWQKHIIGHFSTLALTLMTTVSAVAQNDLIEFEGESWKVGTFEGSEARVENYKGREALYLQRNNAILDGPDLDDMVIEYEYASTHPSGFIGINFRGDADRGSLEQFYTRPHQSGQPDATQYMVMINGVATWQLHAGPNESAQLDIPAEEWVKIRIVALGDKADIFLNDMTQPIIHVPDLRFDNGKGKVALYASDRPWMKHTGAYFSNINVRPTNAEDKIIGEPKDTEPLPDGLIREFWVSEPFEESLVADSFILPEGILENTDWSKLTVESDGVANLARINPIKDKKNTALVKFKLKGEPGSAKLLNFGYSDRVKLFVDGKMYFSGNAQWRSRDHRFLGTVALTDAVPVHFESDTAVITAIVSESFGGWGFKAAIQD